MVRSRVRAAARGRGRSGGRQWWRWPVSLLVTVGGAGMLAASLAGGPAASAASAAATGVAAARPPHSSTAIHPGLFEAVSCSGARVCTAVGETPAESALAERWNGTAWAGLRTPGFALSAVSCPSKNACTALATPDALAWNGRTWARHHVPIPTANGADLRGVSCSSATACTAVGDYYTSDEMEQLIWVGRWNGTKWVSQNAPSPSTTAEFRSEAFEGVSCFSADACLAVGYYKNTETSVVPLIEVWNGATWAIQPSPTSFTAPSNGLYGVSCTSASACTAVGNSYTSGSYEPLAERWNGTTWTVQPTPSPHGGDLTSVSCTSAAECTAVGFYVKSPASNAALADHWNGTAWAVQRVAQPPKGWTPVFLGVSCTSARACTAVGGRYRQDGQRLTLAERWNGTKWVIQPT